MVNSTAVVAMTAPLQLLFVLLQCLHSDHLTILTKSLGLARDEETTLQASF